jgi:hypothetical protein
MDADDYELSDSDREVLALPWREAFSRDFKYLEHFLREAAKQQERDAKSKARKATNG